VALEADTLEGALERDIQEEEEEPERDIQEEEELEADILEEAGWWERRPAGALPIPEVRPPAADYNRN
jgi:hypothetical protein